MSDEPKSPTPPPAPAIALLIDKAQDHDTVDGVRRAAWIETLRVHAGNIMRSGKSLGMTKRRANYLTRAFGLQTLARDMRAAAGVKWTGRPPST